MEKKTQSLLQIKLSEPEIKQCLMFGKVIRTKSYSPWNVWILASSNGSTKEVRENSDYMYGARK